MSFRLIALPRGTRLWNKPENPEIVGRLNVLHLGEGSSAAQRAARTRDSVAPPAAAMPRADLPAACGMRPALAVSSITPLAAGSAPADPATADARHGRDALAQVLQQQVTGAMTLGYTVPLPETRALDPLEWYLFQALADERCTVRATRPVRQMQAGAARGAGGTGDAGSQPCEAMSAIAGHTETRHAVLVERAALSRAVRPMHVG